MTDVVGAPEATSLRLRSDHMTDHSRVPPLNKLRISPLHRPWGWRLDVAIAMRINSPPGAVNKIACIQRIGTGRNSGELSTAPVCDTTWCNNDTCGTNVSDG